LGYGAILVYDGEYSGSTIVQAMITITSGCYMIGNALQNIESLTKGQGAAFKLFSVIQRTSAIDPTSASGAMPDEVKGTIDFKNVSFHYPTRPDVPVFDDFNFTIEAGQTVALVGPSGSGKSSIVGLIQRYYDVSKGNVLLDGIDISELNLKWLRSQIGLVSQEPVLFAGTVAENIGFGKKGASLQEIEEAAKSANAHDFIIQFPG
jgi:ATP-binding cassette subfamily B (MDR/TAP) protein 1